jgi:TonB family protein
MPKEVDRPFYKSGVVKVCFSVLLNGKVEGDSVQIARTSGDPALDRAAAGAIQTAIFPPLPKDFPKKRLVMLYTFEYNPERRPDPTRNLPKPPNPLGPVALTVGYTSKL